MSVFLGLGSNLGDRLDNLTKAIQQLQTHGFKLKRVSPLVETPALLPLDAESEWNRPYLNCVINGQTEWSPEEGLLIAKQIEKNLGRKPAVRWSPRPIDIDILLWGNARINQENLTIPHQALTKRDFVLTPLMHLQPDLKIPGYDKTVFELCQHVKPVPLWMGILNFTPDSFSDGGCWNNKDKLIGEIHDWLDHHIQIIDIGGESTRPNAKPISEREEWSRLESVLAILKELKQDRLFFPKISVDSRNAKTLQRAFNFGANMINDVTGLRDENIIALAKEHACEVLSMHSVTIPADPHQTLNMNQSATDQIQQWIEQSINHWLCAGLELNKIIIDPGIGFGKTALQSMELLKHTGSLRKAGLRLLIGHSRKSFLSGFTRHTFQNRDIETLGVSLALCQQGVDIIRVHNPVLHSRAYTAWRHI